MEKIRVITPGQLPAKYKRRGYVLGQQLLNRPGDWGSLNSLFEGFIIRCVKTDGFVKVTFIAPPGRIVGFNNPVTNSAGTVIISQSPPGQPYVGMVAPDKNALGPTTPPITAFKQDTTTPTFSPAMVFGDPVPETAVMYYSGGKVMECDGCVVFGAMYLTNPFLTSPGDNNPGWVGWDVRWAGAGRSMSLSMSEEYLESVGGAGFNLGFSPTGLSGFYMGNRSPVGYVANKKLYGAVQLINAAVGPIGKLLVFCAEMVDGEQQMTWQFIIDPDEFAELAPVPDGSGNFFRTAVDLPAIIAWVDEDDHDHCVVTCRIKTERLLDLGDGQGPHVRLATGQVMVSFLDGVPTVTYDFFDAMAGANCGLPYPNAAKAYLQRFPDNLFFGPEGLVRHRKMIVLTRPALDIDVSSDSGLVVNADIGYYRTQSAAGNFTQTQAVRGYGVIIESAGATFFTIESQDATLGFATPVGVGEIWSWGYQNLDKSRITMRVSINGLIENLGPCPASFRISTYQREVLNEDDEVVTDMAQLLSYMDGTQPKLAVRKGRGGETVFLDAPVYSNQGLFYLASPLDSPRYGRIYG